MPNDNDTNEMNAQEDFLDESSDRTDTQDEQEYAVEDDVSEDSDTTPEASSKVEKLKKKLRTCQDEKKEYVDELQRQKAEFLNARKRDEEKKKEDIQNANERLILDLLPVIDSFDMAFSDEEAYKQTPENWRKGVEYIYSQILSTLEEYGVTPLNPAEQPFDPQYHEAIEQVPVDDTSQDNMVISVIQKGYQLNDKVIRSAKVRVGVRNDADAPANED